MKSPFEIDGRLGSAPKAWLAGKRVYFDGVFKGDYSLAIVNRELFKALNGSGIKLHAGTSESDWHNDVYIKELADLDAALSLNRGGQDRFDIHLRNTWPPKADDMLGDFNAYVCFAWEESEVPGWMVSHFNENLDALFVTGSFVRDVMLSSGINIPVIVCGNGCDHLPSRKQLQRDSSAVSSESDFRFLHVSSCFPRKGADILVKAFVEEFDADDNVSLLVKTFPNPHQRIAEEVKELQHLSEAARNIHVIDKNLDFEELVELYRTAHVLVAPSRGEGFGLPFAEAMMELLPVITTGWGGQTDFCNNSTADLIDYKLKVADAHVSGSNSLWAEPSIDDLRRKMRGVYSDYQSALNKVKMGRELIKRYFKWSLVADRICRGIFEVQSGDSDVSPAYSIDLISTWGQVCGIGTYAEHLFSTNELLPRLRNVYARRFAGDEISDSRPLPEIRGKLTRPWGYTGEEIKQLCMQLESSSDNDVCWIQHHPGFFSGDDLKSIKISIDKAGYRGSIITLHNVHDLNDVSIDALRDFTAIFVHTAKDAEELSARGLVSIVVVPHGILSHGVRSRIEDNVFRVGIFGFLLPHKNVTSLIAALQRVSEYSDNFRLLILMAARSDTGSQLERARVMNLISSFGLESKIDYNFDFLDEDEIQQRLETCDLLAFPYGASTESASGAARAALAVDRPILVSDSSVLRDFHGFSHVLRSTTSDDIAESLLVMEANRELLHFFDARRRLYVRDNDYNSVAKRYVSVISANIKSKE